MINYERLLSDVNKEGLTDREMAEILEIPESTYRNRKNKKIFKPKDIEIFSRHYKRNINYYFDRETQDVAEDGNVIVYSCSDCIEKQKRLNELNELLKQKENELQKDNELIESQRKYINLLEEMQNIKGNRNCG